MSKEVKHVYEKRIFEGPTRNVAKWCSEIKYEKIPSDVIEFAKINVLDGLGAGLQGSTMHMSRILANYVNDLEGKKESTVWGFPFKTTCSNAALVNGTANHASHLHDTHRPTKIHVQAGILPASIAMAERAGSSGKELLLSFVTGIEIVCRAGRATHVAKEAGYSGERGWHATGAVGAIGAAAAAGKILALQVGDMEQAIVGGANQPIGIYRPVSQGYGKRFNAGKAAANGIEAALLAEMGFVIGYRILEHERGLGAALTPIYELDAFTKGLGVEWETLLGGLEIYPCKRTMHPHLDALFKIYKENDIKADDIEELIIGTRKPVADDINFFEPFPPTTMIEAQHQIPYCMAAAAVERDFWFDQLKPDRLQDSKILEFARTKVKVVGDPEVERLYPQTYTGIVTIKTKDGKTYRKQEDFPLGDPENPMSKEFVQNKFRRVATPLLLESRIEEIIEMVDRLEKVENINKLMRLFRY